MTNNDCLFCQDEIIKDGLLAKTDGFYMRANVQGAMTPGHVMIIPKAHISCFGALPKALDREYYSFSKTIEEKIWDQFSRPIKIEQGVHGQSIPHAHTHFLPSISDWYDFSDRRFIDFVDPSIPISRASGIDDIRRIFAEDGEYVSIEQDGELFVCRTKGYKGVLRAVREIPAKMTGNNSLLDWRTMSEEDKEKNRGWAKKTMSMSL